MTQNETGAQLTQAQVKEMLRTAADNFYNRKYSECLDLYSQVIASPLVD